MTSTFQPAGPSIVGNLEKTAPAQPKQKQEKQPPKRGAPFKQQPVPAAKPDNEPPNPVLQQHGFNGGVQRFNQRVQQAADTYQKSYGVRIPPNVAFDVALSQVPNNDFERMFSVPIHPQAAKARGMIVKAGGTPASAEQPVLTPAELTRGLIDAAAHGQYDSYLRQHADVIADLQKNLSTAGRVNGALRQAQALDKHVQQVGNGGTAQPGLPSDVGNPNNLIAPADRKVYEEAAAAGIVGIGAYTVKGVGQVANALVHSPAGLVMVGKAAGLDTNDAIHGNLSFSRTRAVAKATAKGTLQDIEHPADNPGYLFLDALGLASAGVGTGARLGRAASAAGEAEGALSRTAAAAKGLASKHPLQRATVSYGGLTEEMPLSQNPLVAAAQKGILKVRERGAQKNLERGGPLQSILLPDRLQEALEENLSIPKKIGRLSDVRRRIEHAQQTTLQRELDHVAGRVVMQNRVLARVPKKARIGLTRGEQKAIQVLATDDPTPLETERQFHHSMIEQGLGDEKAHRRQLADLRLAAKALANPTPRFLKALELTRKVVAEQERIKVEELGLLPETAEGRVARLGAFYRGEIVPAEKLTDESFYLPVQPRGKIKRLPSDRAGYYPTKAGPFGVPPSRLPPELTHQFTGDAIVAGDYRIDATHLASEAYARTVRAATVRAEHAKLWKTASKTQRTPFDIPIRDVNAIPDKLRTIIAKLDEGYVTDADAQGLPADMRALIEELYPDNVQKLSDEEMEHVRWIDSRVLGEGNRPPQIPGEQAHIGDLINAPFRFTMLYLRPAYLLNKLGNQAMLVYDQGVFTSAKNIIRAMAGDKLYGDENMRTIRELVGAGRTRSYVPSSTTRASQAVAAFWNRVADRDERVAAFIHYANRLGYESKDDFTRLLNAKESRADLVEATTRANKSLVEFDNLLPFEKNVLRHWVFVYPWVSRSTVWSLRTILDHPVKTDLLAQLGKEDIADDPLNGHVVEWFKDIGYIPVGWHNGQPKVVNPSSINTFSTLGDFLAVTRAATEGDKYASAEDFLGPFPKYMLHAISGRDEYGNRYKGSQILDAAKEVLKQLPQVAAFEKSQKKQKPTKTANVSSRTSIVSSLDAALKKSVTTPGWLDGFGSMIAGGLSPETVNLDAATARYWQDQDPKVRHQHELDLLNRALNVQGEVLKQNVPTAVRSAVADQANISYRAAQFQKKHGRSPTDRERAGIVLAYLTKQGAVPQAEAATLKKNLAALVDPHDISVFQNGLLTKYAHGDALRQWDSDIRAVASFTPEVFNAKVEKLHAQGLAAQRRFQVSQEQLYDYGRRYVAFTHQVKKLQREITDGTKTTDDLRAFEDRHDQPVDGLPSFVRMAWANQTDQEQQQHIRSVATTSWGSLTAFDKTLLGLKSDAKVTAGWQKLNEVVAEQRTKLHREGESFPKGYERTLAKYVEKYFDAPGLVRDYDFAQQPLYARMQHMRPIQNSPNIDLWRDVFQLAKVQADRLKSGNYNSTQLRQQWRDYVESQPFQDWIGEHPSFKAEIASYGKNTLEQLIG